MLQGEEWSPGNIGLQKHSSDILTSSFRRSGREIYADIFVNLVNLKILLNSGRFVASGSPETLFFPEI